MNKWLLVALALMTNWTIEAQISDFENINFKNADKTAADYKGADLGNLSKLAYNLTNGLPTDVEKFRAIYIWVSTNVAADYHNFRKNYAKRKKFQNDSVKLHDWEKKFSKEIFRKLLKEKKTVCTGYAYLIKKLANSANINCEIINGYGRISNTAATALQFPNHSWNAVQLNNKWYLCDAAWSSGLFDWDSNTFKFNYNNGYFLTSPEWFALDHFPVQGSWFLLKEKPLFSDFIKAPIIYNDAFACSVFPIAPGILLVETQENKEVLFILKDLQPIDIQSVYLEIVCGNKSKILPANAQRNKEGLLQIKNRFAQRGSYDVHIKVKDRAICTYTVKVKA